MSEPTRQTLHLHNRSHRPFEAQPITYGVPWPRGAVRDVNEMAVLDEKGRALPAAFTTLNRWPDGSVQWSLADVALDLGPSADRALTIDAAAKSPKAGVTNPVTISTQNGVTTIGNGLVQIVVSSKPGELLRSWTADGKPVLVEDGFDITSKSAEGQTYSARAGRRQITVEHRNAVRSIVRVDGKHAPATGTGGEFLDYYLRVEVTAGRPDVKLTYGFRNREQPTPGITVHSMYAEFRTATESNAKRCFTANNLTRHYLPSFLRIDEDPEIVASDTADFENYTKSHKEGMRSDCFVRDAAVLHDPPDSKPWFLKDPKFRLVAGGNKCVWPYLALVGKQGGVVASFSQMTSLHPKSLRSDGSTLRFGIWPDWAGPLEITQGAGRSHSIFIAPLNADVSDERLQNHYLSWEFGGLHTHVPSVAPVEIKPDIDHVRRCGVFGADKLPAYDPEGHFSFERKVLDAWIGVSYGQLGAVDQVEPWPANGFWNHGDRIYDGVGNNNEEMHALVYLQQHLRTGNWACAEYGIAAARHITEVDFVDYSVDAFQNGGMVSHSPRHNHGAAYPSHMWFTELLVAYALTGDAEYKRAAMRICDNLLHWINTDDGFKIVSSDQREAGQPMINLTWCYGFNPDPRYLEGVRKIIHEYLMASVKAYGRMLDPKPLNIPPVKIVSYGDYASWEGMYWYWEVTRDEEVKRFMLEQLEWRLAPRYSGVHGFHRATDYNPAAYAYYMSGGDEQWVRRVARPFRAAFRAAKWPIGWVHAMYYIKLAFDLGIVNDEDVLVQ